MAQGLQQNADSDDFLLISIYTGGFGFGSRSHNIVNGFADCQDRTIWFGIRNFWRWRRSITQDIVARIATLGIGENKIARLHPCRY
jgi:hypothetical protein